MTQEEVMTYIAECNSLEDLGDILENVKGRLEVIIEFIRKEN